ncbi:hypothetical protein P8452_53332 [Trifolium repens]|nr:hypothetical protein P8452_53332 [Trifolium repens]
MHILCMSHLQPSSGLKATNCSLQEHYSNTKVITGFFIACSRAPSLGFSNNSSHLLLSTRGRVDDRYTLEVAYQDSTTTTTSVDSVANEELHGHLIDEGEYEEIEMSIEELEIEHDENDEENEDEFDFENSEYHDDDSSSDTDDDDNDGNSD